MNPKRHHINNAFFVLDKMTLLILNAEVSVSVEAEASGLAANVSFCPNLMQSACSVKRSVRVGVCVWTRGWIGWRVFIITLKRWTRGFKIG